MSVAARLTAALHKVLAADPALATDLECGEQRARIADLEEQLRWCKEANAELKQQLTEAGR